MSRPVILDCVSGSIENSSGSSISFTVAPALGRIGTGQREPYSYLVESIRHFPDQDTFSAMIAEAGLGQVNYRNLSGGIAMLHSAWRL